MSRIDSLTDAQRSKFPEYVERWTAYGLSTEPADRPRAEKAMAKMYEIAGLDTPRMVWCDSPLSMAFTRYTIASIRDSVRDSVRASVGASVRDSVRASVWDSVRDSVRDSVWDSVYGQHDASWLSYYRFFYKECGLQNETKKLEGLWELCKSAGWALPCEDVCFISERHNVLSLDEQGRLHCEDGPACAYPDGFAIYAWHGVRLPEWIIEKPQDITVEKIDKETNAEIRRVMVERYGTERFLKDGGANIINQDNSGVLYRREIPDDEPLVMVHVQDPSTDREYFLRVPPTTQTARQAVAWTFEMDEAEYQPEVQT